MERQAGLGRSLDEVIASLTPAEPETPHPRGAELHDITPRLYRLMVDVEDLRRRVDRLEAATTAQTSSKKQKKSKKQRNGGGHKKTKE